ncbi:hypothetical protein PR002_g7132 [Phytophthora rubi]|uniref:Uncharacterized protein n=1 Tax=Phytophthora rubi TaxID=129364 RepID=A0A6A3N405_9STRA|nr:hypothetical protein PR002_g7132 [Phytophthora rubi]
MFEKLAAKFTSTDANRLEPVTEAFLKNVDYLDRGGDKCGAFGSVLAVRIEWLKQQIQELNKPFSWEMPDAEFQGHPQVQAFLRGPDDSMTTKGVADFEDLQAARNFAAESMRKEQVGASFEMEAAEEGDTAFVNICKTRDLHLGQQTTVAEYSTELKLLVDCYDEVTCGLPKKRARVEGC